MLMHNTYMYVIHVIERTRRTPQTVGITYAYKVHEMLEGPAIRTAIVTKERCESAGRELVSVRVQAGAKSVVPA